MTIHAEVLKEMAVTIKELSKQRDALRANLKTADEEVAVLRNELALMRIERDQYQKVCVAALRQLTDAKKQLIKLKINDDKS